MRLADGVELLGEYEGSGFKEPRYLVRRPDGQMVQLTQLLYLIAEAMDGRRDLSEIAEIVGERYGRGVSADNVKTLVESNLAPDGLIAGHDGAQRQKAADPLLALKLKFTLLPAVAVNAVAGLLRPLFWPPVIVVALLAFGALDVWYFGVHGIAQSLRDLIYQPLIVLLIYGLLIVSIGWHELGHATACRYGGARPGRIGFGIYVVWPAFFTDVTDALKLGKGGRVRTDLGGMYFNVLFSLAVGGLYFLTRFEPLLVLIVMQHLLIFYNLMPFLRLDGYHAISDITGIPDLFGRLKPAVKSLVPGQETSKRVSELKPWARAVVTIWSVTAIPIVLYLFAMMVLSAPRVVATGWDSLQLKWDKLQESLEDNNNAAAGVAVIESVMIVLPASGMFVTFARVGKKTAGGLVNVTRDRPIVRGALGSVGAAAVVAGAFVLIPNGEYKPIQPDEQWTFDEGIEAAADFKTGRPSLSEEREADLDGASSLHGSGREFESSTSRPDQPSSSTEEVESEEEAEEDTAQEEPGEDTTTEEEPTEEEEAVEESPTPTETPTEEESPTP